jgi:hypothetical protein
MICNPKEQAAQERGYGVIIAKIHGKVDKFAEHIPKEYADGLGKIAKTVVTCCPGHPAKTITFENGGAWQGPCPCRVWCAECAKYPTSMGVLASERGLLAKGRDAKDYHVCFNCEAQIDDPRGFTPLKVDQLLHVTDAVNTTIDALHEASCAAGADAIDGVRDEPAVESPVQQPPAPPAEEPPAPPVEEPPVAPPKKKGPAQGGGRRDLSYFEQQSRAHYGRQAPMAMVSAHAATEKAAYEKKLADGRKKRQDDKDTLKRARETKEELEAERADRAKFQKMLDFVLDKCHVEGWADRVALEAEADAAAAQE